jgi:alpha-ketoglutarate-dependent taurine dioxygenase
MTEIPRHTVVHFGEYYAPQMPGYFFFYPEALTQNSNESRSRDAGHALNLPA